MSSYFNRCVIIMFVWTLTAFLISLPALKALYVLNTFNRIKAEARDATLFGSDYLSYQQLQQLPATAQIAMLIPHDHFRLKSTLFLYPRQIVFFTDPKTLQSQDLHSFDAILVYAPLKKTQGIIAGLNNHIFDHHWQIADLLFLESLSEFPASDSATLDQKMINQEGNLLYLL